MNQHRCAVNWITRCVIAASTAILISGCGGGGGGGGGTTIVAPPAQESPPPPQPPQVQTAQGLITGLGGAGLRAFFGVRYAAAPVGELRFKGPEPPPMIVGNYDASSFRSSCPQIEGEVVVGDEDCLFLNVWTNDAGLDRPVLVFIHGGGFERGSASQTIFNGESLSVNGDVVVVTPCRGHPTRPRRVDPRARVPHAQQWGYDAAMSRLADCLRPSGPCRPHRRHREADRNQHQGQEEKLDAG